MRHDIRLTPARVSVILVALAANPDPKENTMSLFTCCLWWFVLGLLLGWLLNWLLSKLLRADPPAASRSALDAGSGSTARAAAATVAPAPSAPPGATAERLSSTAIPAPRVVDVSAARASGFNLKHADDLTIIEGIGPKIDELFRASGVSTFASVARLGVAEMQAILDKGGPHFKLANPGSWAQQALLASENRWAELKRLQHELIGGIAPPADS
jgi:predicted flap endonuclease-1-like 5' DNA nuclease